MYVILFLIFSLLSVFSFQIKTFRHTRKNQLKASLNGFELGAITLASGLLLDNTVSKKSLDVLKSNSKELYNNGMKKVINNLLVLGPIYYLGVENFLIKDTISNVNFIETFNIVLVHSFGYYLTHRAMHKNDYFKKFHNFHHKFNETLVPSIGNAVSEGEFTFAYMFPFVIGTKIYSPNINSLNFAIMIVSIMNLIIHCQELKDNNWNEFFVSPETHLNHHQSKNKFSTYSAPTFNLENIFRKILRK